MQWLHRNLRGALSIFPSIITQRILGLLSQSGKDGPLSIPAGQQGCSLRSSIVTENKIHVTSQSPKPRAGTESKPPGWVVATHPLQPPASPPGLHSKRQEQSWRRGPVLRHGMQGSSPPSQAPASGPRAAPRDAVGWRGRGLTELSSCTHRQGLAGHFLGHLVRPGKRKDESCTPRGDMRRRTCAALTSSLDLEPGRSLLLAAKAESQPVLSRSQQVTWK